eukprot:TRINITY_DN10204_c0_g1_i1.p1 TRINITY_DN10204_c0_g1~~TRINITY_DN10204_c0_g1_i1.p1  ORF type:complete len:373 (+),score=50.91 TRINITY_DN10204_c0_g1_i1:43-1161(+)
MNDDIVNGHEGGGVEATVPDLRKLMIVDGVPVDTRSMVKLGCFVGAVSVIGVLVINIRKYKAYELEALLCQHVGRKQVSLVNSDVMRRADLLFRGGVAVHIACSRICDETSDLLLIMLQGRAADETFKKTLSNTTRYTRFTTAAWDVVDCNNPFTSPYRYLSTSYGHTPLTRIIATAKNDFENSKICSLDPFVKALEVLVLGPTSLDPNTPDERGSAPIHSLSEGTAKPSNSLGQSGLRVLMENCCLDVNAKRSSDGATALHILCSRLLKSKDIGSLVCCISMILAHEKIAVNTTNSEGDTCLNLLVSLLAKSGEAVSAENTEACLTVVSLLFRHGADKEIANNKQVLPYIVASRAGHQKLCKLIASDPHEP